MRVLLVNMPFSAIRPAIGAGLLKAHLARIGVPARVAYLNLRFAELIGPLDYFRIAEVAPPQLLIGDWAFSDCLFGERDTDGALFLGEVTRRFPVIAAEDLAAYQRARDAAAFYLDECMAMVDWGAYDVVGFTTTFSQTVASLGLARRVKERFPQVRIVFGGANCEGSMGLQLHRSFPFIDYVCAGEADLSFPQLIRCLQGDGDAASIKGVVSRRGGASQYRDLVPDLVTDMDGLPYPDYDEFFAQHDRIPGGYPRAVVLETARGCWWGEKHHCTFCGLNGLTMAYRAKRPERALQEIIELSERYDARGVFAVDNILDMRYFRTLLPQLKEARLNLHLFYETKANLTREQVRLLREAGVTTIQPGIESFSTQVLQIMRKGTSALQNIQLLKWCKEYGVAAHWNILYGFPGESSADYDDMAALMEAIGHLEPPQACVPFRLDRFSPYFTAPDEFGLRNVRPDRSYRYVYDLPEEQINDLAYYFEYDHADGRDPEGYMAGVHRALEGWLANAGNPGLVSTDDGSTLTLWDYRPGAGRPVTQLSGPERAVYLACDHNQSAQQLRAIGAASGIDDAALDELVQRLVAGRLMVTADGRYLSLAVPATAQRM